MFVSIIIINNIINNLSYVFRLLHYSFYLTDLYLMFLLYRSLLLILSLDVALFTKIISIFH